MNIIFVSNAYHPKVGGVEIAVAQLAKHLSEIDCHVEVVTARNPISLAKYEVIEGVPVHRVPFYVFRDSLKSAIATIIGMPWACSYLYYLARKLSPCIIHVQFIYHNAVAVELIRQNLQSLGIPIVVTFHGGDAPKIPDNYKNDNQSESKILNWAANRLIKRANVLSTVSYDLKYTISKLFPDEEGKIQVVHNGVDTSYFTPLPGFCENNTILSIGRLSHAKGFDILINAFAQLVCNYPNWRLHIAGDGELRIELQDLVEKLRLQESVKFLGMLSPSRLVAELNASAFGILASRGEGFGIAVAETMSCGKPIIITDTAAREIVEDGKNGLIVPCEDTHALTQAMQYLISQPELRREMGRRAREHVVTHFTWEQSARNYKQIYRNLLHGAKAGTI